jgi:NHL repeat
MAVGRRRWWTGGSTARHPGGVHGGNKAAGAPGGRRFRATTVMVAVLVPLAVPTLTGIAGTAADAAASVATVAGTGHPGMKGAGGAATAAELDGPTGIAVDAGGDVFVADTGGCAVDEIPANGATRYGVAMEAHHLYIVAGGRCGSGSGAVGYPTGVAVDPKGDVFVADATGERVLELRPGGRAPLGPAGRAGLVTTVAGTGRPGTVGVGGPAVGAELDGPTGVAVDGAGDLFVADTVSCQVDEVPAAAGTRQGTSMQAGHLYVVAGTGVCGTAGGGGPANEAELYTPTAVAVDAAGDLFVADRGAGQVVEVPTASGTYYGTPLGAGDLGVIAGAGILAPYLADGLPARGTTAEINFPYGLAVAPDGALYVTDTASRAVRQVPAVAGTPFGRSVNPGDLYTLVGAVPTGTNDTSTRWTLTEVTTPYGVAVASDGDVLYSDRGADVVREVSP